MEKFKKFLRLFISNVTNPKLFYQYAINSLTLVSLLFWIALIIASINQVDCVKQITLVTITLFVIEYYILIKFNKQITLKTIVNFIKSKVLKKKSKELKKLISVIGVKHPTLLDVLKWHSTIEHTPFVEMSASKNIYFHIYVDGKPKFIYWNIDEILLEKQSNELIDFLHDLI